MGRGLQRRRRAPLDLATSLSIGKTAVQHSFPPYDAFMGRSLGGSLTLVAVTTAPATYGTASRFGAKSRGVAGLIAPCITDKAGRFGTKPVGEGGTSVPQAPKGKGRNI